MTCVQLRGENADLRLTVQSLEKERDFYFSKLREIEIMLQVRQKYCASWSTCIYANKVLLRVRG